MAVSWVVNASPLILLGKIGRLELLPEFADLEARRCAKTMGLRIIGTLGTLGVIGRAKLSGSLDAAAPVIDQLRRRGLYVSDSIVRELLWQVGEPTDV